MVLTVSACGLSGAKREFAEDLSATILDFDDPETIRKGVPAYLILTATLVKGDPENAGLLEASAKLFSAYASSFTDSSDSRIALSARAFDYASRAMCLRDENFCDIANISYFELERRLAAVEVDEVGPLYVFVTSWAGAIDANSADWNAVADLPKVKSGLLRVLQLDETVGNGNALLYMAVMESLLPPSLGGKPELAKSYFEQAIEISEGKNLMAKVLYAEKYGRMMFDRKLHDEMLHQVLQAENQEQGQRLVDMLAKQKAAELLRSADDYF